VWFARPQGSKRLADALSAADRARYEALARPADRARFATGRLLARAVAAHALGWPVADVRLTTRCRRCGGPHGKPYVAGAPLELSIAHAHHRVVVAAHARAPVGVDVEPLESVTKVAALGRNLLSAAEQTHVAALAVRDRPAALLAYWVRKEAILKATGDGLGVPLSAVTVSPPDQPARLLGWDGPGVGPPSAAMADVSVGADYLASVAVLADGPLRVTVVEADAALGLS
jgi:4'-phosphopantetheinyl transferase